MKMFLINPDDKAYNQALEREIGVWEPNKSTATSKIDERITELNSDYVSSYSTLFDVDDNSSYSWIHKIKKEFGTFDKCLSLGSGSGVVESKFIELGIVSNFDTLDVVNQSSDFGSKNHSITDLNFVELPKNKYDFVLCKSILHHIINIEHLIEQINSSLKQTGVFIVFEFVGESKAQWSESRKKIINQHLNKEFGPLSNNIKFIEHPQTNTSPFECIRSGDILKILDMKFENNKLFEFKWGKFSYPIIAHFNMLNRYRKSDLNIISNQIGEIIKYFVKLDLTSDFKENMEHTVLFSAYSKSESTVEWELKPFGKYEKDLHFKLNQPLKLKIRSFLRNLYYKYRSK